MPCDITASALAASANVFFLGWRMNNFCPTPVGLVRFRVRISGLSQSEAGHSFAILGREVLC